MLHGCFLGIGEGCGNASMEQLLLILYTKEIKKYNLSNLNDICLNLVEKLNLIIPSNQPIIGSDAFNTCAGTHAAAMYKGMKNREDIEHIYTPYNPEIIGKELSIGINKNGGISNLKFLNEKFYLNLNDEFMNEFLNTVKNKNIHYSQEEFLNYVKNQSNQL